MHDLSQNEISNAVTEVVGPLDLVQAIEARLTKKEHNAGQLIIALERTYPEIYAAIEQLQDAGKVVHGWKNGTLTYYLKTSK